MSFRRAVPADAEALRDLDRDTNVVALAHIFPSEQYPFPEDESLAQWRCELADPAEVVEVVDGGGRLACFLAHDDRVIHRLAVHPDAGGRGLGRRAVERAVARMTDPTLWCLELNTEAQAFYRHLGWSPTGRSRPGQWPPYPTMGEWALDPHRVPTPRTSAGSQPAT